MTDKEYCMSSFLAFRYVVDDDKDFADGLRHEVCHDRGTSQFMVADADDLDVALTNMFSMVAGERLGVMLSGGMDSGILASYMPRGADAYTFRFLGGSYQQDELHRAEQFAEQCGLRLHYVDIDWSVVESSLAAVMQRKGQPVHSIEPQIYYAAQQAKRDGIEMMVIGDGADFAFGGLNKLYDDDWSFDSFVKRYIYVDPAEVLRHPADIRHNFEPYRLGSKSINFMLLMEELAVEESYGSYDNAFKAAGLQYIDPYAFVRMSHPLNVKRLRTGDSKYIVRDLFRNRYPMFAVPEKVPMPRPVDEYFKDWKGPQRPEFRNDIDISQLSGNQRWLVWCLERFLNMIEEQ